MQNEFANKQINKYPLDVSDLDATVRTIAEMEKEIGFPNLVVLNAGTHMPISVESFSVEKIRTLMEVNFMGVVNALSEIIPKFVSAGEGHVAIVASLAGYRGLPSASGYGASKAALINMCESLRPELMKYNVRLTLINPGFVETPLTDQNDFEMPFIITAKDAAERIFREIEDCKFEIVFPKRFAFIMKVLRLMPYRIFFSITKKLIKNRLK